MRSNYIPYPVKSVAVRVLAFKTHLWSLLDKDLAITNSYLPRDFECIQVRNVITYAIKLTEHLREFCQSVTSPSSAFHVWAWVRGYWFPWMVDRVHPQGNLDFIETTEWHDTTCVYTNNSNKTGRAEPGWGVELLSG